MPEWLVEEGIGEDRAVLVERGAIRAARVDWGDPLRPGAVLRLRLETKYAGTRRGIARAPAGTEVLLDALPATASEGSDLLVLITREAIAERGRHKRAQGRSASPQEPERAAPSLFEALQSVSSSVRRVRLDDCAFSSCGWDELVEEAATGEVAFAGGSLTLSPTPAMTLIDVDGPPPARVLALAAVPAIAAALDRMDVGGSIGIDFPTLAEKSDRHTVDRSLEAALRGRAHERTAMNGFGFVQIVARLERPSILARYQAFPARTAALGLLRRAEATREPGVLLMSAHPALRAGLPSGAADELARRTGRLLRWHWDESLALASPTIQIVGE